MPITIGCTIIGVRTPDLRRLAKELLKGDYKSFIKCTKAKSLRMCLDEAVFALE